MTRMNVSVPEPPEPSQMAVIGGVQLAGGFVAFLLAQNGIAVLAPAAQAGGFSAAGLALLVSAALIKVTQTMGER